MSIALHNRVVELEKKVQELEAVVKKLDPAEVLQFVQNAIKSSETLTLKKNARSPNA